jgi:phage terminase Nu1 subunit (DNA packaging protein)
MKSPPAKGLSYRAFALKLGISHQAVSKAVMVGTIPAPFVGKDERGRPCILRPDHAAAAWRRNRDPTKVRERLAENRKATPACTKLPAKTKVPARPSQAESRAIEADYKARMARLDYEERVRDLVSSGWMETRLTEVFAVVRNRLLGLPSKAKSLIPRLTVADVELLENLVRDDLEALADGAWRGPD